MGSPGRCERTKLRVCGSALVPSLMSRTLCVGVALGSGLRLPIKCWMGPAFCCSALGAVVLGPFKRSYCSFCRFWLDLLCDSSFDCLLFCCSYCTRAVCGHVGVVFSGVL